MATGGGAIFKPENREALKMQRLCCLSVLFYR